MRFGERLFGRKADDKPPADTARLNGVGRAAMMEHIAYEHRQKQIQQALGTRQLAKILGMPPRLDLGDDEMIAGGDITVKHGGGNLGPWIFASALMLTILAGVGFGAWWLRTMPPAPIIQPAPNRDYVDIEVIPGS